MSSPEKSRTYEPELFNAPEFDVRYEVKTKFYHLQLQGNNVVAQWGKISADKPQGCNLMKFKDKESAMEQMAKLVREKTTGKEKYQLKEEKGSRKVSDLPAVEARTSGRKKKPSAAAAEAAAGEEATAGHGEEVAGKKRGASEKDQSEEKTPETSGAGDAAAAVSTSESKKQKTGEGETASSKGASPEEGAPGEYALMSGGEQSKKLEEQQHKQQTASEVKTNEMVEE